MTSQTSPSGHKIARNTTLLTGAYILQKVFAFVYFTLIARWIGPADVGKYVFAVSLTTLLAIFIDLGMTPVLIRETSKFKESGSLYLGNIMSLKLILGVLAYIAAQIIVVALHKDQTTLQMVSITGLVMVLDSFTLSFFGILRANQNLSYEAISIIFNQLVILMVGIAGLWLKFPLVILAWALLGGSLVSFIFSLILLKRKELARMKFNLSWKLISGLLIIALPFALAGVFTRIYSYIDQVLLSVLIGDKELGWYSVAYKITFAFQFIPSAFAAAIYPAMSNYFQHAPQKLSQLFEKSMFFLMLISLPVAAGIAVAAPELIRIIYGTRYLNSILPLQILIVAMPAIFLSFPVGSVLNSTNRQHLNTINLGVTMVINVILNLILIPKFQYLGAAFAATVSLYYLFLGNYYFVRKAIAVDEKFLIFKFMSVFVASGIMGAAVYVLIPLLGIIVAAGIGAILWLIVIFILKVVTSNDLNFIKSSLVRKAAPEPEEVNV